MLPAYSEDLDDAILDDVARTIDGSHPPKPLKAGALCDVYSTTAALAVKVLQEHLDKGASLVAAHGIARTGDACKVIPRDDLVSCTAAPPAG